VISGLTLNRTSLLVPRNLRLAPSRGDALGEALEHALAAWSPRTRNIDRKR
jgi:hypothetical protein